MSTYTDFDVKSILDVMLAFNSETNYSELLNVILTKMMEITVSDAGTLYIIDGEKLHFRIIKNISLNIFQAGDEVKIPPVELNKNNIENISAYSALFNEIIKIDDVYESDRFNFNGPKKYDSITGYRTKSMLVLPLCSYWDSKAEVLGVIQLLNATNKETGEVSAFGNIFEPPIIPALANIAGNTLSNLIHFKEIKSLFQSFVSVMAKAIDERSLYNSYHTQNVTKLCTAFAEYISRRFEKGHKFYFNAKRHEELAMAATLHDIGKIVTPLSVMDKADRLGARLPSLCYRFEIKKHQLENDMLRGLMSEDEYNNEAEKLAGALSFIKKSTDAPFLRDEDIDKIIAFSSLTYRNDEGKTVSILESKDIEALSVARGTLTDGERKIMQEHASVTSRFLDNVAFSKYYANVPKFAKSHHEFLDGSGYPHGLKDDEISVEVCIITIMDIFEALTASDRPYKKALPIDSALKILSDMADGGKLHRELVDLFCESKIWESIDRVVKS